MHLAYDDAQDYITGFELLVWRAIVSRTAPPPAEEWRHRPWLRRCLHRYRVAFTTAGKQVREHEDAWPVEISEASLGKLAWISAEPTPEEMLCQKEGDRLLHEAISHLHPASGHLVVAHYLEGRSIPELALALGRTPHAITQSLHNARVHLRQALEKTDADEGASASPK